jgi:hypothetical protein
MTLELSHTGLVVDDLKAAMKHYRVLNLDWADPVVMRADYQVGVEVHRVEMLVTYSRGPGHHIELMQPTTTALTKGDGLRPPSDHVGFWTDDVMQSVEDLVERGYRLVFHRLAPDGRVGGSAYLTAPQGGLLIELVDAARRAAVEAWCLGGALAGQPSVSDSS